MNGASGARCAASWLCASALVVCSCNANGLPVVVAITGVNVPNASTASTGDAPPDVDRLDLHICPRLTVANRPVLDGTRVRRDSPSGCVNGVELLVAPAPSACLSSGFGPRGGRLHRGIDLHRQPASRVVAAASGVVRESTFRAHDFGHWVVVDHGDGVLTAYAHLERRGPEIYPGARVGQGQPIGIMGRSGRATRAVHLHYEVRVGDYARRGWFGLRALDPLTLPSRCS